MATRGAFLAQPDRTNKAIQMNRSVFLFIELTLFDFGALEKPSIYVYGKKQVK